jgi:hypothetical protein
MCALLAGTRYTRKKVSNICDTWADVKSINIGASARNSCENRNSLDMPPIKTTNNNTIYYCIWECYK